MQQLVSGKRRLPGFSDPWSWIGFADVFGRVKAKNADGNTNVLTISAQHGLISQVEYFNKTVASDDVRGYTLLQRGDFAYNKSYSDGYPKRHEFDQLFAEAAKEYRAAEPLQLFLMIAYYTGARSGAIMDLRWSNIDFDRNVIDYRLPDRGELIVDHKPRAVTPMAPPLRAYLLQRYEAYEKVPEFVFHQKLDHTRRVNSVVKGFRATVERCGFKDVTPHTLRHTRVTELRNMGMHSHQVDAFLAMTAETQDRVYTHADHSDLQALALQIA